MTIKHMKIFAEVCRMESVTLAAENLNMQQPAVSLAIKEMESYYGIQLFERMNRKIYITENGKTLYDYSISILNQFYEAENVIRNTDQLYHIKVGSVLPNSFISVLKNFSVKQPHIRFSAVISNSAQIEELLLKNELDIGVIDHSAFSPTFHTSLLYEEKMLVVCGRAYKERLLHPLTISSLAGENLLLREHGTGHRDNIENAFLSKGYHIRPTLESTHIPALIEAAICNLGILVISEKLIKRELNEHLLYPLTLSDYSFTKKYHIAYHKNKYLSKSLQHFVKELEKILKS